MNSGDSQVSRDYSPLSQAPLTAVALLVPFFLAAGLMLLIRDAGMQQFRFLLTAVFLIGVGALELVTGLYAREDRGAALYGLRRHILALAVTLGLSFFAGETWLTRAVAMVLLFGIQWGGSAAIMHFSTTLEILIRYSKGCTGVSLASRMRDTIVESADFSKHASGTWKMANAFLVIQFTAVLAANLAGVTVSWITAVCLAASIFVHGMLRFLFSHMSDIQGQLHQGLIMPRSAIFSRAAAALLIIIVSLSVALVISPGLSFFPPDTIARWLTRTTRITDMPDPAALRWDSYFSAREPRELLEGLEHGEPSRFFITLLRILGAAGLAGIIFLAAKPLFLSTFYQSIREFHPLLKLIRALKLFLKGILNTILELLNLAHLQGAQEITGTRLPPPLQAVLVDRKVSRKKQRERSRVIRAFVLFIEAAESAGIRYRTYEGPGDFIMRSGALIKSDRRELAGAIRIRLNQVLYSGTPLEPGELPVLIRDMKQLRKDLLHIAEAQEKESRDSGEELSR